MLQTMHHILPIRIFYADTDASGLVHHSNYFKFFERGRTEALREQGFDLVDLYQKYKIQFVVHSAEISFLRAIQLDQLIFLKTKVIELRPASIIYQQELHRNKESETLADKTSLLCQAKIKLATVNEQFKPCAFPEILQKAMAKLVEVS